MNISMGYTMIDICVAGAMGKMGRTVIEQASNYDCRVVGAIESSDHESIGRTLSDEGVSNNNIPIRPPDDIPKICDGSDVYISFTTPSSEVHNLPLVAQIGTPLVVGTTGFSYDQLTTIKDEIRDEVCSVFAPNFSLGINLLYELIRTCDSLPSDYDFSITEMHHKEKQDAPSGTAVKLSEIVSEIRGYTDTVNGREGNSPREESEMEVLSVRAGGTPGIHDLIIAGPDEMLRIEHSAFSKDVFASGALFAAHWVTDQKEFGTYSMSDVLEGI